MQKLELNQVWRSKWTNEHGLIVRGPEEINMLYWNDKKKYFEAWPISRADFEAEYEFVSSEAQCFWNSIRNQMPYG